jgi:hypothetical protein
MGIVHIEERAAGAGGLEDGPQIDSPNAFGGEVRHKQIVFGNSDANALASPRLHRLAAARLRANPTGMERHLRD